MALKPSRSQNEHKNYFPQTTITRVLIFLVIHETISYAFTRGSILAIFSKMNFFFNFVKIDPIVR